MKKLLLSFALFPLFLPSFSFSSIKNVVEGSGDVTVESSVSTTVNGENVTVKSNQPGSVEVKNVNGKVEIKTSEGITPTIIITGVPTQKVEQSSFSKIINNRTVSISSFLRGFFKGIFGSIFSNLTNRFK